MIRTFGIGILKHGSLEVALGAVVMCRAVAFTADVVIPWAVYAALFLAVWFIYILDRLFDARKISGSATNPRHLFYQEHHAPLLHLLILIGGSGLIALIFLPRQVLLYGVLLMGCCLLYLLWVFFSSKSLPKEIVIAVLYTTGISLAPMAMSSSIFGKINFLLLIEVFLMAFVNLVLFSRHEREYDILDRQESFITRWKMENVNLLVRIIFALAVAGVFFISLLDGQHSLLLLQLLLLVMLAILWVLFQRRHSFKNVLAYRLIGDCVFLLPVLLFF